MKVRITTATWPPSYDREGRINSYGTGTRSDRPNWAYAEVGDERREWQLDPHENRYAPFGNYALELAHQWADARYAELRGDR